MKYTDPAFRGTTNWLILRELGAYFRLLCGQLQTAPEGTDLTRAHPEGAVTVSTGHFGRDAKYYLFGQGAEGYLGSLPSVLVALDYGNYTVDGGHESVFRLSERYHLDWISLYQIASLQRGDELRFDSGFGHDGFTIRRANANLYAPDALLTERLAAVTVDEVLRVVHFRGEQAEAEAVIGTVPALAQLEAVWDRLSLELRRAIVLAEDDFEETPARV
jgi:hypothetical protein